MIFGMSVLVSMMVASKKSCLFFQDGPNCHSLSFSNKSFNNCKLKFVCDFFKWNPPTPGRKYYSVCDVGTEKKPRNWIYTDFIPLQDAKLLDIVMGYQLRNCPKNSGKHCKTYFELYAFHVNNALSAAPIPAKVQYQFAAKIMPKTVPEVGERLQYLYHGKLVTRAQGIYLGFLDQGACVSIENVTIGYRYCSKQGPTLVEFPRIVAPANDSHLVEQAGKCSDPNSVSKEKLSGMCLSSGEWNITVGSKCLCKEGYELLGDSASNSLECKGVYMYVMKIKLLE